MSSNRYNKPKGTVPDFTPRGEKKVVEPTIAKEPCLVCKKMCHSYGRHEEGQCCSSKCETLYTKPQGERDEPQSVDCFNGPLYVPDR